MQHQPFPPWFANAQDLPAWLPGEKREATRLELKNMRTESFSLTQAGTEGKFPPSQTFPG